jgi:hypothetical protein
MADYSLAAPGGFSLVDHNLWKAAITDQNRLRRGLAHDRSVAQTRCWGSEVGILSKGFIHSVGILRSLELPGAI